MHFFSVFLSSFCTINNQVFEFQVWVCEYSQGLHEPDSTLSKRLKRGVLSFHLDLGLFQEAVHLHNSHS